MYLVQVCVPGFNVLGIRGFYYANGPDASGPSVTPRETGEHYISSYSMHYYRSCPLQRCKSLLNTKDHDGRADSGEMGSRAELSSAQFGTAVNTHGPSQSPVYKYSSRMQ